MNSEAHAQLRLAPPQERQILDEIRNDRDLIDRLKITPQELEALSKCALLGTLTSKEDMLFILRVIRDATGPAADRSTVVPQPSPRLPQLEAVEEEDDPAPDFSGVQFRATPARMSEPGSLETIVRHRMPEQFGVLLSVLLLVAGFVWCGVNAMAQWRDSFITLAGSPAVRAASSEPWYSNLDRFNVLLTWETLFVGAVAGVMYLRSRSGTRRLKVRPGRRLL